MVEAYISTMGGHFYFSFPGDILCQFHHQLCPQFRSGSKGDPLILGTQEPNLSNHSTAVLDRSDSRKSRSFLKPSHGDCSAHDTPHNTTTGHLGMAVGIPPQIGFYAPGHNP